MAEELKGVEKRRANIAATEAKKEAEKQKKVTALQERRVKRLEARGLDPGAEATRQRSLARVARAEGMETVERMAKPGEDVVGQVTKGRQQLIEDPRAKITPEKQVAQMFGDRRRGAPAPTAEEQLAEAKTFIQKQEEVIGGFQEQVKGFEQQMEESYRDLMTQIGAQQYQTFDAATTMDTAVQQFRQQFPDAAVDFTNPQFRKDLDAALQLAEEEPSVDATEQALSVMRHYRAEAPKDFAPGEDVSAGQVGPGAQLGAEGGISTPTGVVGQSQVYSQNLAKQYSTSEVQLERIDPIYEKKKYLDTMGRSADDLALIQQYFTDPAALAAVEGMNSADILKETLILAKGTAWANDYETQRMLANQSSRINSFHDMSSDLIEKTLEFHQETLSAEKANALDQNNLAKMRLEAEKESTMEGLHEKQARMEGYLKAKMRYYGVLDSSAGLSMLAKNVQSFNQMVAQTEMEYNLGIEDYNLKAQKIQMDYTNKSIEVALTAQKSMVDLYGSYNDKLSEIEVSAVMSRQQARTATAQATAEYQKSLVDLQEKERAHKMDLAKMAMEEQKEAWDRGYKRAGLTGTVWVPDPATGEILDTGMATADMQKWQSEEQRLWAGVNLRSESNRMTMANMMLDNFGSSGAAQAEQILGLEHGALSNLPTLAERRVALDELNLESKLQSQQLSAFHQIQNSQILQDYTAGGGGIQMNGIGIDPVAVPGVMDVLQEYGARITSPFGADHSQISGERSHGGVDVSFTDGRMHSVTDGEVLEVGSDKNYGNYIRVVDDQGNVWQYGHSADIESMPAIGDTIRRGDVLGIQGSTGTSTGPHTDIRMVGNVPATIEAQTLQTEENFRFEHPTLTRMIDEGADFEDIQTHIKDNYKMEDRREALRIFEFMGERKMQKDAGEKIELVRQYKESGLSRPEIEDKLREAIDDEYQRNFDRDPDEDDVLNLLEILRPYYEDAPEQAETARDRMARARERTLQWLASGAAGSASQLEAQKKLFIGPTT